ncbi:MAG: hypothetical protein F4W90_09415 [Gammaproteobacteria bacterium]|nr:hypothetical protein [Gammaproteobacteria bacterium]
MPNFTVEVARLNQAARQLPLIVNRYHDFNDDHAQNRLKSSALDTFAARKLGQQFWRRACSDVQQGGLDDRPLYWGRLALIEALSHLHGELIAQEFDRASRNLSVGEFDQPEIVLTGFDPFRLDSQLDQCNPSGIFALALDGLKVHRMRIRTMIFPVRYADFDARCVEDALTPILNYGTTRLVITASMGRDGFDLERFPAKCRGSSQADNAGVDITQCMPRFKPPLDGPDFLEFSLPATALLESVQGGPNARITDNRQVATIDKGVMTATNLNDLAQERALAGSGGNFLSNEISYRALRRQSELGTTVPLGHIHVPRIEGYDLKRINRDFYAFHDFVTKLAQLVVK